MQAGARAEGRPSSPPSPAAWSRHLACALRARGRRALAVRAERRQRPAGRADAGRGLGLGSGWRRDLESYERAESGRAELGLGVGRDLVGKEGV